MKKHHHVRVLVIGLGGAFRRCYPTFARLVKPDHLRLSDIAAPAMRGDIYLLSSDWLRHPDLPEVRALLEQPYDYVFVQVPQHLHSDVAQVVAAAQIAFRKAHRGLHPCYIILEKPIDAFPPRVRALLRWVRDRDPAGDFVRLRGLSHFLGKKALHDSVAEYERLGRPPVRRVLFLSWERAEMSSSGLVWADGAFAEHAIHSPACAGQFIDVQSITLAAHGEEHPIFALRYLGAPTAYDCYAHVTQQITTSCQSSPVELISNHARLAPSEEDMKFVITEVQGPAGVVTLIADLNAKRALKYSEAEGIQELPPAVADGSDSYEHVIEGILGGRVDDVTLSLQRSLDFFEPIYDQVVPALRDHLETLEWQEYQEAILAHVEKVPVLREYFELVRRVRAGYERRRAA